MRALAVDAHLALVRREREDASKVVLFRRVLFLRKVANEVAAALVNLCAMRGG
jgi:hypothetical protein